MPRREEGDWGSWNALAWGPPLGGPAFPAFIGEATPGREIGDRRGAYHRPFEKRHFWNREPVTAGEIMTAPVRAVTADATVRDVAEIMRAEDVGIVPVVDDQERLIGVVTDRDVVARVLADRDTTDVKVSDVMSTGIEVAHPDESVADVLMRMRTRLVQRIPVVRPDHRLLGIVSLHDIARRAEHDPEIQQAFAKLAGRRSFWTNL